MGAKRYEAYRNGAKFGDVAKPAATYRATLPELPQTPGNGPISPPQTQKIDRSTLPDFDGSPKQNRWAEDLRTKALDDFEAADVSDFIAKSVAPIRSKPSSSDTPEQTERRNLNALIRAEIDKRGEAAVLADVETATREIAAEMFANPSARDWIDGRDGPSVWARAVGEARRRVATTGSAAKPKPAFDLPPLDLPELVLTRLEGTPRQQSWAEDLRRRAVRDLTEERANETARDNVRHWRQWSSRRDAKRIRETSPELEAAISEVGGDDAAAQILGREALLKAREYVEKWSDSRDWIDLKVEQKIDLNAYAAQKVAGTPKEAAAILRRYAADAKTQGDAFESVRDYIKTVKIRHVASKIEQTKTPFRLRVEEIVKERRKNDRKKQRLEMQADRLQRDGDVKGATAKRKEAQKIERESSDAVRSAMLDLCFPINNPESSNRDALKKKTPSSLSGVVETTDATGKKKPRRVVVAAQGLKEIEKGLDFIGRLTDNIGVDTAALQGVRLFPELSERAFYTHNGGHFSVFQNVLPPQTIVFSPSQNFAKLTAHEFAHALEHNTDLNDAFVTLYRNLTTGSNGKRSPALELESSKKKRGQVGYRPEYYRSVANPDYALPDPPGFTVPTSYALRSYKKNQDDENEREAGTELLSVWVENFYQDPANFALKHERFFHAGLEILLSNVLK